MGRRGPLPQPGSSETKRGRNTMYKKPTTPPPAGDVVAPDSLADRGDAVSFWNRHAPGLAEAGRLRQEQAESFAILCHLFADIVQLTQTVAAEGFITATDKGQAASPVAKLLRDARRDFVALARDFGLTAASEARLPQEPTDASEEDEEAALLKKLSVRNI